MEPEPPRRLTKREHEIVVLIGKRLNTRQIADQLGIAYFTVRKHRSNLLYKLSLHSSAQLSAYAAALISQDLSLGLYKTWHGPP